MQHVVLLNSDYTPLGIVDWHKAIKLIVKGKVEVVKATQTIIHNFERTFAFAIPLVIRLVKFVRSLWKTKVPFNKRNVLIRDNFTCQYCGKPMKSGLSIDHVVPKSKGGKSTFENTVASCVSCNNKKDNRSCSQAKMYPKKRPTVPTINEFLQVQIKNAGLDSVLREIFG